MSVTSLQCAVLAMDAYNREYTLDPLAPPLDIDGAKLLEGGVSIKQELAVQGSSFYAVAYQVGTSIVIAFRGTDDALADGLSGWGVGIGDVPEQARIAAEFVRDVVDANPSTEVVLAGHSMGGGLAGFCATLFDLEAYCFNTMSWQDAAENAHALAHLADTLEENEEEVPPSMADLRARVYGSGEIPPLMTSTDQATKIHVTTLDGEILEAQRNLGGGIGNASYDELSMPSGLFAPVTANALHMQEQLIIRHSVSPCPGI